MNIACRVGLHRLEKSDYDEYDGTKHFWACRRCGSLWEGHDSPLFRLATGVPVYEIDLYLSSPPAWKRYHADKMGAVLARSAQLEKALLDAENEVGELES